tara:strand:+ start:403 stop:1044 length:642 start_codon:yes stop_codon:yes gene_type:complete
MIDKNKAYKGIINGIRLACLVAFIIAIYEGRFSLLFGIFITLFSTYLPAIFERRTKIKLPVSLYALAVLFIFASLFLGEFVRFYDKFFWWDSLLHTASAFAFGLIGFTILYILVQRNRIVASPLTLAIFSFLFAVGIGATWEVIEFFIDNLFLTDMQKSGLDTMGDLMVDMIGGLIAAIFGYKYIRGSFQFKVFESWRDFVVKNRIKWKRLLS